MSQTELTYEFVNWLHGYESDPIQIVAELDDIRCEVRKIEIFRDGTSLAVSLSQAENGSTFLSWEPWPTTNSINEDGNGTFEAKRRTKEHFEKLWTGAILP